MDNTDIAERELKFFDPSKHFKITGDKKELKIPYSEIDKIIDFLYDKCIDNKIDCQLIIKENG